MDVPLNGEGEKDILSLRRDPTNASISMPLETFEKIYLNPRMPVRGHLRSTLGNPTPLCLVGFIVSATPLACTLMGWRGSGGAGAATIGVFYFFGGLLQIIGSVMEWILGNSFPCVVFGTYGAFWLALAATLQPSYNAEGAFTSQATTAAETAAGEEMFLASYGFFLLSIGIISFMFMILSLRINLVFFLMFLTLDIGALLLTASYWKNAQGDTNQGATLQKAGGACFFTLDLLTWYLLFAQLLSTVDFPLDLPVGDLSGKIKGRLEKNKENGQA